MIATTLENVRVAWDGLRANKLRSALTMLGVIIGVGTVVALLAIGEGAKRSITDRISSVGTNVLFVSAGFSSNQQVRGAPGSAVTLTQEDAEAIADPANVSDVVAVAPEYSSRAQAIYADINANVSVMGTTAEYLDVFGLEVASGRFIDASDVDRRSTVVVLGYQVARDLFGAFDPVGLKIKLQGMGGATKRSLTVVGVLGEQGGSMMSDTDDGLIVPISTARTRLFSGRNPLGKDVVSRIDVMASSEAAAVSAQAQITALLQQRHEIGLDEADDFTVTTQSEMLSMAGEVTGIMRAFLAAIAAISLIVGGIGIMNIMLVSVTERTREIGLRKALGALRSDILAQFLFESVVLSALGGVVGVLVGIGAASIVNLTGLTRAVTTPSAIVLALGAALAVGLFFGLYPANRAAALSPIEALHYE